MVPGHRSLDGTALSAMGVPAILPSMSIRRGWVRLLIGTLALLQLAVAPALALVDGEAALAESTLVTAHVESHSTPKCLSPHAADCGLCQFLSHHVVNDGAVGVAIAIVRHASVSRDRLIGDDSAVAGNLPPSRAPPVV
jgi:hypothetical protein